MEALKFSGQQFRARPRRAELDARSGESLTSERARERQVVYVVRNGDIDDLRHFDGVIDRGRKHAATPLSPLLLAHAAIPFIRGSYRNTSRVVRSVRALLSNAVKNKDGNIYIVGVELAIWRKLWQAAEKDGEPLDGAKGPASMVPCQEVLDLLRDTNVPAELEQRFIGTSPAAQLVRRLVVRAASTAQDVLILGDTGTGKEVVARAIHHYSGRQPFEQFNCAAFAGDGFEAALFGEASSDRGGGRSRGAWQAAGAGMILLDEIGELRLDQQAKILRALEERRIRPVGARSDVAVPARVLVASNRDLFALVRAGQFRDKLYYRLRSFTIRIPTLRARREDIAPLAQTFWRGLTGAYEAELPTEVAAMLAAYSWPGNARELKSVLAQVHALFGRDGLRVRHLRAVFRHLGLQPTGGPQADGSEGDRRIACLRHLKQVEDVLRACRIALAPLVTGRRMRPAAFDTAHTALHHRLGELEILCRERSLFGSDGTFSAVDGLKGKLASFHELLDRDAQEALRYWTREVDGDLAGALKAIVGEEERLVADI